MPKGFYPSRKTIQNEFCDWHPFPHCEMGGQKWPKKSNIVYGWPLDRHHQFCGLSNVAKTVEKDTFSQLYT